MLLIDQLSIISRINFFIGHKATGTPEEFAQKLDISRRMLFKYLKILKEEFDAPIIYSPIIKSYQYTHSVTFKFGYEGLN